MSKVSVEFCVWFRKRLGIVEKTVQTGEPVNPTVLDILLPSSLGQMAWHPKHPIRRMHMIMHIW
jgi:hypothetical protein